MSGQSKLEPLFHKAMLSIYTRAKSECNYNATRFLNMVSESGGLTAAKTLLHANTVSEGFEALWERGRLDLTVEALVLDATWKELFTEEELAIARKREEKGARHHFRKLSPPPNASEGESIKSVAVKQYPNGVTTETGGDPFRWYVKVNGQSVWCRQARKGMQDSHREDNAREQDRIAMRYATKPEK